MHMQNSRNSLRSQNHAGEIMNRTNAIDCIVRFHNPSRIKELERCMFSLAAQQYEPLNIILVLQRFSEDEIKATRAAIEPLLKINHRASLSILNWTRTEPLDGRSHLLNVGLKAATGRYLAFLDYDDVLFPEAYAKIVARLQQSGAAIGFASVELMKLQVFEKFFYIEGKVDPQPFHGNGLLDLFRHNFCPLHSYVFDRSRISSEMLYFDTSLTIEEDYDLLLRICARFKADLSLLGTNIGYYFFKSDGSNTVANMGLTEKIRSDYGNVCARIEQRRQATYVSPEVQTMLGFGDPHAPRTIRDVLRMRYREQKNSQHENILSGCIAEDVSHKNVYGRIFSFNSRVPGGLESLIKKTYFVYRYEGFKEMVRRIYSRLGNKGK